ncbi:ABC-2 transporter permease [Ruminococcus sp.]|uniref:ABC-2 transporter permease n=1 Tax=Ruminococcus sp. TaxID=41978 RepID=UPI0025CCEEEB|nr:ABC-2 transporter permease [Ruminococcus sp.]
MKGLIIKELITMFKNNKLSFIVIPVFALFGVFNNQNMFLMIVPALLAMIPLGQMTHDELCHWDRYVQCLPVDKNKIVSSKYAMVIVLSLIATVIIGAVMGIINYRNNGSINEVIFMMICSMMIGLSVPCISIPINLKFGTAKGRIIYLIIVGIICGTMPALLLSDSGKLSAIMVKLFSNTAVLTAVSFAVLVAMILISWLISIKIYEAKEV